MVKMNRKSHIITLNEFFVFRMLFKLKFMAMIIVIPGCMSATTLLAEHFYNVRWLPTQVYLFEDI